MSRLTTRLRVDAMIRRAQSEGGFATVLVHGDDSAGSLILVLARRDGGQTALARTLAASGYAWTPAAEQPAGTYGIIDEYVARQRRYDPDLWVLELDIADAERFVAESSGGD